MISMHNISSAGHALQYFSKDNYYTKEDGLSESEWFGKGAKFLGLTGQIEQKAFFDTLNGKFENQELGKWVKNPETGETEREHRAGIDVTFSAPKSVSLLAEVFEQKEVRLAHEEAVKEALNYIEKELSVIRHTVDHETTAINTGNLVIGTFRHNTSRDLDPQTHTHAVVMNATRRADGQWRSLTNDEIYKAQRLIGAIYTSELANRLQKLGYTVNRSDKHGNFEIEGISREQIKHFSQRREKIEALLEAKGINLGISTAQQREEATLKTRAHKANVDHEALISDWKSRAKDIGINFEEIAQKVLGKTSEDQQEFPRQLSGIDAMNFAVKHLLEREAVVSKSSLLSTAIEHSVGRTSYKEIERAFKQMEKNGELVTVSEGLYTSKKMHESELWSLEHTRQQKSQTPSIATPESVMIRIETQEKKQGFQYSEGQKEALLLALTSQDRTVAIQGLAGTGKTTMLRALREIAQEQHYIVRGMAPTGAASKVLAKETGIITDTVTMFQIKERQLQKDIAFTQQYASDFVRKSELWVIDESSFLSQTQKVQLDRMAEKAGAKVIYLGDSLQLQAVQAGKPFELAQKQGIETAYMTEINRQKTESLRTAVNIMTGKDQLDAGQRLTQIEALQNTKAFNHLDKAGMVLENKDETIKALVQDFFKLDRQERQQTLIITAYNTDRKAINEQIRGEMKTLGEITHSEHQQILVAKGWTQAITRDAQYYQEGDIVRFGRDYQMIDAQKGEYMQVVGRGQSKGELSLQKIDGTQITWQPHKHNKVEVYDKDNREIGKGDVIRFTRNNEIVKNGEVAKVVEISGHQATLEIGEEGKKSLLKMDLSANKHWEHGYASTVHSSQGTTKYRTFFHINAPQGNESGKIKDSDLAKMAKVFGERSFYVGVTRASHKLAIYTNDKNMAAQIIGAKQDKSSVLETLNKNGEISLQKLAKER